MFAGQVRLHNLEFMIGEFEILKEKMLKTARTELSTLYMDPWVKVGVCVCVFVSV